MQALVRVCVVSAEVLREAAALMRERAEAASPSPWSRHRFFWKVGSTRGLPDEYWVSIEDSEGVLACMPEEASASKPNAEYIASWHPAVALAVADWLDLCAEHHDELPCPAMDHAATVARAYLGESS